MILSVFINHSVSIIMQFFYFLSFFLSFAIPQQELLIHFLVFSFLYSDCRLYSGKGFHDSLAQAYCHSISIFYYPWTHRMNCIEIIIQNLCRLCVDGPRSRSGSEDSSSPFVIERNIPLIDGMQDFRSEDVTALMVCIIRDVYCRIWDSLEWNVNMLCVVVEMMLIKQLNNYYLLYNILRLLQQTILIFLLGNRILLFFLLFLRICGHVLQLDRKQQSNTTIK